MSNTSRTLTLLCICIAGAAMAQVNDNCSGAIDIDLYTPDDCPSNNFNIDFSDSGISTNPPFCDAGGSQIRDLWYRFYSANNTTVSIYLQSLQFSHVGFGIYTSCGGAALACLSNVDGYVNIPVSQNTHYYLQIYTLVNFDPSSSGFFCLHWNNAPPGPPANDDCPNATLLNVGSTCTYTNGNGAWATWSNANLFCDPEIIATPNDDVWYRFVAPAAVTVITVDGDGSSTTGYNAVLVLGNSNSCSGSVNPIACSNTSGPGGVESITTDVLVPGTTYYVRVYDVDGASPQPGTFGICVYAPDFTSIEEDTPAESAIVQRTGMDGTYHVRTPFPSTGICQLHVLDAMGHMVHAEGVQLTPSTPHLLDLSKLVPGTYVLALRMGDELRVQRFVHF